MTRASEADRVCSPPGARPAAHINIVQLFSKPFNSCILTNPQIEEARVPGRPCQICSNAANLRIVADMIVAGASDQMVADRIGGISRMAVARHRQNHIERPARAIVAAANKGKDVRDEREQIVAAAEAGDTAAAFLALNQIAADLRRVQERLERTADATEADSQRLAVASLSGQQLRAAEVRAKLGGVGGYAPTRSAMDGGVPIVITRVERVVIDVTQVEPKALEANFIEHDDLEDQ